MMLIWLYFYYFSLLHSLLNIVAYINCNCLYNNSNNNNDDNNNNSSSNNNNNNNNNNGVTITIGRVIEVITILITLMVLL